MKTSNAVLTGLAVAVVVAGLAWAIDVDVSGDAKLPTVDMEMTEGEMPEVNVETVDVDVQEREAVVEVPDVSVEMEERTIPYPDVEVTPPADAGEGDLEIDGDADGETDVEIRD